MKRANLVHSIGNHPPQDALKVSDKEGMEIQKAICELKDLLRSASRNNHNNAVVSDRRTYKTTALIQFVIERLLILPPPARVGVVCPNRQMMDLFAREYQILFPALPIRNPLVATIDEVLEGCWRCWDVPEVYAEEMFMIPASRLRSVPNFIAGIGTLN